VVVEVCLLGTFHRKVPQSVARRPPLDFRRKCKLAFR
jgi:hypothetical protein